MKTIGRNGRRSAPRIIAIASDRFIDLGCALTEMLRDGASLTEIGELLRHRHPNTTTIYAKVDLPALRKLALAWPGGDR